MGGSMGAINAETAKVVTVERGVAGKPDVRIFDLQAINDHITKSMSVLGPTDKVAFIAYADGQGVKGAIVGRLETEIPGELKWTLFAEKPYGGAFIWGAGVKWSI